ncbi:MAG: APC family permease [Chloroflexi bacterium]|nr:MAG: APC family permease [Chloroflexota bacterium]
MQIYDPETSDAIHRSANTTPRRSWRTWLIGRPLPTADAAHQTIGKRVGLAVFASDALSSTAYATQEILVILAAAGVVALQYAFPIAVAIVVLMIIVVVSYEQTIHAYPSGGGAYVVSRENLGEAPAEVAGAALLTDYILTVAVSISSGVAMITSAFPALFDYRIEIALLLIGLVMVVNLRGVKESGMAFAIPAYVFLIAMLVMVAVGMGQWFLGTLGLVENPPEMYTSYETFQLLTPFLLLHAFASGTSAMTGIEAIANGVTAFKEPRSRNAGLVLIWMATILATLFLGITFLANEVGAMPSEIETVVSQIARTVFYGQNFVYLFLVGMTAVILVMAANTAFAGFPRLAAILAQDGFMPRQFTYRGSRLVFSRGIVALALIACILVILFDASVNKLIPLYAIGVFLSFTLSQVGMAVRWWKSGHLQPGEEIVEKSSVLHYDSRWMFKMVTNSLGAFATAIVTLVFGVTKFRDGAWIVVLLIPLLVLGFTAISKHYQNLARQLSLDRNRSFPRIHRQRVILLISGVHQGTLAGLRYAHSLTDDVTAVYVSLDHDEAKKTQEKWRVWGEGVRLVILDSPYRLLIEPILEYIETLCNMRQSNEVITVVVPQFVSRHWWTSILHNQTAFMLRLGLIFRPGVIIIEVPYQVD